MPRVGFAVPVIGALGLRPRSKADARALIIELTPRGRQALRVMRSNALEREKRWQDVLGEKRLSELGETLVALLAAESGDS
jgi:DNA-binding MarR family transcriptional regulator